MKSKVHAFFPALLASAVLPALLLCCFIQPAQAQPSTQAYANARCGFTVSWPSQLGRGTESDNGDGITVRSADGSLELKAWGINTDVMGMSFQDVLKDVCSWFDTVEAKDVQEQGGTFTLRGSKGTDMLAAKGCCKDGAACLLLLRCSKKASARYASLVEEALQSFHLTGTAAGMSGRNASALLLVHVQPGVDADGCRTFWLTAQQDLALDVHKAELDSSCALKPGRKLWSTSLRKGTVCELAAPVPEGCPGIIILAGGKSWIPAFSGEDGSLVLADGFAKNKSGSAKGPIAAKVHIPNTGK